MKYAIVGFGKIGQALAHAFARKTIDVTVASRRPPEALAPQAMLIKLAKEKGVIGYPGDGANVWPAVHARDLASLFCLALEKGPAGKYWHGIEGEGYRFREIAEATGSRLGLPAVSIPVDALMLPGYFGFFTNLVTLDLPASNAITRQALGWEPVQPGLLADLDNGHYFPAG